MNDVTHRKRVENFGISKKSVCRVENRTPNEKGRLSLTRGGLGQVSHEMGGGGRWKSQNRKNMYLSPCVEEPLNSKVIKSFVPELRSRKCFSCFEIPMLYIYIYIYIFEHYMSISHIRIWLWYIFVPVWSFVWLVFSFIFLTLDRFIYLFFS